MWDSVYIYIKNEKDETLNETLAFYYPKSSSNHMYYLHIFFANIWGSAQFFLSNCPSLTQGNKLKQQFVIVATKDPPLSHQVNLNCKQNFNLKIFWIFYVVVFLYDAVYNNKIINSNWGLTQSKYIVRVSDELMFV